VAINLSELPAAMIQYLLTKVDIDITLANVSGGGPPVNPGDTFEIRMNVDNASSTDDGIALTDVRYELRMSTPGIAQIRVPGAGTAIDGGGNPIPANTWVEFLTFNPSAPDPSYLSVGESDSLQFAGRAIAAGSTQVRARIQADPDINALFPRNHLTATHSVGLHVSPDL
jgi:hypothetical protein